MSFGICSTISDHRIDERKLVAEKNACVKCPIVKTDPPIWYKLVCYTPKFSDGTVSCLKQPGLNKCTMMNDQNLVFVPANAIIDSVEYIGHNEFSTKEEFTIGLGQLNQGITFPLIEDGSDEIANERVGGCRQFLSVRVDGRTDKTIVSYSSNVNVFFNQPVTSGTMAVIIYYHMKST